MSNDTNRHTTPAAARSVEHRLARFLDSPFLARVVPHLAPETLHQIIRARGLDACGEMITSVTPAQLTSLLDLDLWPRAEPGRDQQFDVARFGEWLEVLVETGESTATAIVASLETQLIVLGLSRYLRVFDPGTFEPTESSDDEASDRHVMMHSETSSDVPECEVGGYLVRARRTDAWDAIVAVLIALDSEHNHCFHAVMHGCRPLSNSKPEVDGLDELLMASEQHDHDVSTGRESRRSRQGYATPADARAFLQLARRRHSGNAADASVQVPTSSQASATTAANPLATAYFRAIDEGLAITESPRATTPGGAWRREATGISSPDDDGGVPASIDAAIELLTEAGLMQERRRALLGSGDDARVPRLPHLTRLMEYALQHDEVAYGTRNRELAFLANALLAGCSVQSRAFTPQEAADAAAGTCNLGLEFWITREPLHSAVDASLPAERDTTPASAFLLDHDLVAVFEVGWSRLHRDVSLFAVDQLIATLPGLRADVVSRHELSALQHTLLKQRDAGTPWLARDATEVLAVLDMTASVSLRGLLDECPILPATLTAVLERRIAPVSPTAFEFISTTAQIEDIRHFMRALPDMLSC